MVSSHQVIAIKSHLDQFYSKVAKALSEFVVLSIIKEHPDIHTYEIQQILSSEFKEIQSPAFSFMKESYTILDSWIKSGQITEEVDQALDTLTFPQFKDVFKELLHKSSSDQKTMDLAKRLYQELSLMRAFEVDYQEIWLTNTGIYQLMNKLETSKLIEVSNYEIVKGRTRKLYGLTIKGEHEIVKMFFLFISLNKLIIPKSRSLHESLSVILQNHVQTLLSLFEQVDLLSVDQPLIGEDDTPVFRINPFLQGQIDTILLSLAYMTDDSTFDTIPFNFNNSDKASLLDHLKRYHDRLSDFISYYEDNTE